MSRNCAEDFQTLMLASMNFLGNPGDIENENES